MAPAVPARASRPHQRFRPQSPPTRKPLARDRCINLLEQERIRLSQLMILSRRMDLPRDCLETPGRSICCLSLIRQQVLETPTRGERRAAAHMGPPCIFFFPAPNPDSLREKNNNRRTENKSREASSGECIAPAKQSLFN